MHHGLSHCATAVCAVEPAAAFAFLADVTHLGSWALGCWAAEPLGGGVVAGTSLFDGSRTCVRAAADVDRLAVDFEVGPEPEDLVHRISARVVPGRTLGYEPGSSVVSLIAWRDARMSDERWQRLAATHEAEILLLQARLEERR